MIKFGNFHLTLYYYPSPVSYMSFHNVYQSMFSSICGCNFINSINTHKAKSFFFRKYLFILFIIYILIIFVWKALLRNYLSLSSLNTPENLVCNFIIFPLISYCFYCFYFKTLTFRLTSLLRITLFMSMLLLLFLMGSWERISKIY